MEPNTESPAWPVVGHDWAVDLLRSAASAGRPPHALLITGSPNVGKGTLARSLAQALLCTETKKPCGQCRSCSLIAAGTHPDVHWVEPQGGSLKISQVRELTRQLTLAPLEGPWRIAILDRFEMATPGAANALLKTLEEPPPTVVLALLAQQADALLPTIVSRCQVMTLRPIPRSVIAEALVERWEVDAAQAEFLSHICGGRLGWAVSATQIPALLNHRSQVLDDLASLLQDKRAARFAYVESLARQSPESINENLELWTSWWRDVLLLTSRSTVPTTNIDRKTELTQITRRCDTATAQVSLRALQRTMDQLSRNANTRLALEVLFLDMPYLS